MECGKRVNYARQKAQKKAAVFLGDGVPVDFCTYFNRLSENAAGRDFLCEKYGKAHDAHFGK